jgi:hypothetical protein
VKELWRQADLEGRILLGLGGVVLAGLVVAALTRGPLAVAVLIAAMAVLESAAGAAARMLSRRDGLVAIDEVPRITAAMLDRFYVHGFDPELGWIRKANTFKKDLGRYAYRVDERGSRANPGHEKLPLTFSTYGDSYTFCREVEDSETWQWFLAERTGRQVLNFGVGNYGLDQAILRLEREYPSNPTPIVIVGVVPQTFARNLSVWKHYNEFGNVLAFKPRFVVDEVGQSRLVENPIRTREQFLRLADHLDAIQRDDYFYERRFTREALRAPFCAAWLVNWRSLALGPAKLLRRATTRFGLGDESVSVFVSRYLDRGSVAQTAALMRESEPRRVFEYLVDRLVAAGRRWSFVPVLAMLPMRDDLHWIRRYGLYYEDALAAIADRILVVDAAPALLTAGPTRTLYRQWHYSPRGNQIVADVVASRVSSLVAQVESARTVPLTAH